MGAPIRAKTMLVGVIYSHENGLDVGAWFFVFTSPASSSVRSYAVDSSSWLLLLLRSPVVDS